MAHTYNFNAGPAALPHAVMLRAQEEFADYCDLGYGILEASHRSPEFAEVIAAAEANLRELLLVPDTHAILFLQGGASLQFAMMPMNLLPPGGVAAYVDTGAWSGKAIKEAQRQGEVRVVASGRGSDYTRIPDPDEWDSAAGAAYLHITSNNTIAGTQYRTLPTAPDGVPLLADMSSDILSRRLAVADFGLIYAGAQKNLGPSGVTLVILERALAARAPGQLPTMLNYNTYIDKQSLFNTPPTFAIYMLRLVTDWVREQGGLDAVEQRNIAKADALYACIDHDAFYRCPVAPASRSRMNVCFRLPSEALEQQFLAESVTHSLVGLKGHRSVGGMRASVYNAMPPEGVAALVDFMCDFRRRRG